MQGATHKHEHTRATAVLLMGGPTLSFTLVFGTFMIYQSRAIEQYPTGIRALLAGVSGLLYRRSTWVAFFVETQCGRTVPCRPSKARASHHMLGRDQARPYLELSPAVFGFQGPGRYLGRYL